MRKIPIFKLNVLSDEDYMLLNNIPEVKEAIIDEVLLAIKEGIEKNRKKVSLFSLADSQYYIILEKPKWIQSLETARLYYENEENYEKCIECRDLIKKISYGTTGKTQQ